MTRKIYINLARKFADHDRVILSGLVVVGIGGFFLLLAASQLLENSQIILGYLGKLWFSLSAMLGALFMVTQWFNPDRDMADVSSKESFLAMVINFVLFIAFYAWFME